jgi:hypothetical protein
MAQLKAFVRIDGTGRVVPGTLLLRYKKPGVGNWMEIDATECCNNTRVIVLFSSQFTNVGQGCIGKATLTAVYVEQSCFNDPQPGCLVFSDAEATTYAVDGDYLINLPGAITGYARVINGIITLVSPC